jgi:ATP-dependent RNA helicase RhlE
MRTAPFAGLYKEYLLNTVTFAELGLASPLLLALDARGHSRPTPIQARAIPELIAGRDLLGIAQTGTGKTGAFALPILHLLSRGPQRPQDRRPHGRHPRVLVLAPTRELAIQIGEEFRAYGQNLPLRQSVIFGGVNQRPQVKALMRGLDILVATPGRLLDLMNQGHLSLGSIEHFVLDEADRMLDMGFLRDLRKILAALPRKRQSLLFSATMAGAVAHLPAEILTDPLRIEVTPRSTPVERILQSVRHVPAAAKKSLLADVLADPAYARVMVFARTKHRANRVADQLAKSGIAAEAIHGNKSQGARQRALANFRGGHTRVLVATDIAARGIDVEGVSHVINYELPNEPESYVHRIGRTARAGAEGTALSFCDPGEHTYLRAIERLIGSRLEVIGEEPAPGLTKVSNGPRTPANRNAGANAGAPGKSKKRFGKPRRAGQANGRTQNEAGQNRGQTGPQGTKTNGQRPDPRSGNRNAPARKGPSRSRPNNVAGRNSRRAA